ncbi:MAG: hypothetical protein ACOYMN_00010 [Roseimicrobium sp.]
MMRSCARPASPSRPTPTPWPTPASPTATNPTPAAWVASAPSLSNLQSPISNFQYTNDPQRPHLLSTVTGPAHVVTNNWEPDRDVLGTKANQTLTGPTISAYDYTVNNVGQRTKPDNLTLQRNAGFDCQNALGFERNWIGRLTHG